MKVLLLDRDDLFLEGLQYLLISYGFHVLRIIPEEITALRNTGADEPLVLIINASENLEEKPNVIQDYQVSFPAVHIIVFTDDDNILQEITKSGVSGYLLADIHVGQLIQQIREVERQWRRREVVRG
jgi:DNA-binding NarL/FixJ family response regulator